MHPARLAASVPGSSHLQSVTNNNISLTLYHISRLRQDSSLYHRGSSRLVILSRNCLLCCITFHPPCLRAGELASHVICQRGAARSEATTHSLKALTLDPKHQYHCALHLAAWVNLIYNDATGGVLNTCRSTSYRLTTPPCSLA